MMSVSLADLAALAGAVVLAGLGGEAFLKSILGVAMHLRLPKAVVATTLAAFATFIVMMVWPLRAPLPSLRRLTMHLSGAGLGALPLGKRAENSCRKPLHI